jgi:hypothetical protein
MAALCSVGTPSDLVQHTDTLVPIEDSTVVTAHDPLDPTQAMKHLWEDTRGLLQSPAFLR